MKWIHESSVASHLQRRMRNTRNVRTSHHGGFQQMEILQDCLKRHCWMTLGWRKFDQWCLQTSKEPPKTETSDVFCSPQPCWVYRRHWALGTLHLLQGRLETCPMPVGDNKTRRNIKGKPREKSGGVGNEAGGDCKERCLLRGWQQGTGLLVTLYKTTKGQKRGKRGGGLSGPEEVGKKDRWGGLERGRTSPRVRSEGVGCS